MSAIVRYRTERDTWVIYFRDRGRQWQSTVGQGPEARAEAERIADAFNAALSDRLDRDALLYPGAAAPFARIAQAWWDSARPGRPNSSRVMLEAVVFKRLIPYFGDIEIRRLDADRIRAFVVHEIEDKDHARETVESSCSWLRRILNWAVEKEVIEHNPVPKLMAVAKETAAARARPKRTPPAWSHDEVRSLLAVCNDRGPWLHDPVDFASRTGCRRGELLALEWTEVDLKGRRVTFLQSHSAGQTKSTKADRIRTVDISDATVELLQKRAWAQFREEAFETMEQPGHVFLDRFGKPWTDYSFSGYWMRARRLAHAKHGVRPFKFHAFRHTWATWALASGEDPAWCASQIGDTLEVFLRRYAHAMPGRRRSFAFEVSGTHAQEPLSESRHREE